ncbi:MAG: phenylacetate-CoA oxygenase/reductase subunit PaaK [Lewinellaceae bacterium]|nr:phenylacetate-CoA oxygenase/reductase subunit PaaK [Lewinellaceae bacterium]
MSTKYFPLRIRELHRETADTVSISFEVPAELREPFRFIQGQHLNIRTEIDGEEVRRSYSICTGTHEQDLRVAVKKVDAGLFSTFANEILQAGDTLDVMPPQGHFYTELDPGHRNLYVAFAAGSGITPVMSILKTTLVQEPQSRFILFYGNRGFDHIIFREQLEALKNLYPDRLAVHHVLSRESLGSDLFAGRMDADKCRSYGRLLFRAADVDAYFICGPEEMTFEMKRTLEEMSVDPKKIHFELFTTAGMQKRTTAPRMATDPKNILDASVTVIQDGMQIDFQLTSDGSSLLDAAMRAGADLPFSCKGGVCSTCKAKILEGEVDMEVNYGLEPEEVEAGFILTCQSHPRTKRLVVSFDA